MDVLPNSAVGNEIKFRHETWHQCIHKKISITNDEPSLRVSLSMPEMFCRRVQHPKWITGLLLGRMTAPAGGRSR